MEPSWTYGNQVDFADAVVQRCSAVTQTEAADIGDAREFLRKDGRNDSFADRDADSTSNSTKSFQSCQKR
jgi:hypothetical protein